MSQHSLDVYLDYVNQALDLADTMATEAIATDHDYFDKGKRDFALDKDHAIEERLKALLGKFTPDIPILGEEKAWDEEHYPERFWVIDPIDGTVNYSRQLPLFGITVVLMENQQPIVAGISFPHLRERYTAIRGGGAYLNHKEIHVAQTAHIHEAIIGLGDFSTGKQAQVKHQITHDLLQYYGDRCLRIRMLGSAALQLAWLASGRIDMSITLSNKAWDVQAGVLLIQESGGLIFDHDGSPHNLHSAFTLASTSGLKEDLLTFLSKQGDRLSQNVFS